MRHGARTPIKVFPTDPNKVEDWPSQPGTLTNQGLEQVCMLGLFGANLMFENSNFDSFNSNIETILRVGQNF